MPMNESCHVTTSFGTYLSGMADTINASKFGRWVRDLREGLRLSQAQAARRVGIDRQQWYRIETGRSGTSRETAIAIADALEANRDEALYLAGFAASSFPSPPPQNLEEFLAALDNLGVPGLEFGNAFGGLTNLSPEDFEKLLKDVRFAIELSLKRYQQ